MPVASGLGLKPTPWLLDPARIAPEWHWAVDGMVIPFWEVVGRPIAFDRGKPIVGTVAGTHGSAPLWGVTQDGPSYAAEPTGQDRQWAFTTPTWFEDLPQGDFSVVAVFRVPAGATLVDNQSDYICRTGGTGTVVWWGLPFGGAANEQFLDPQFDDNVTKITINGTIDVTGGGRQVVVTGRRGSNYELWVNGVLDGSAAINSSFSVTNDLRIGGAEGGNQSPSHLLTEALYFYPFALNAGERASLQADPFGPLRPERERVVIAAVAAPVSGPVAQVITTGV